ncbi:FG-GAP-like repeat-containing protein [Dyadobacter sp. CY261]|uniref:FG-GAP-like repeat-containing protein n=1 Tax=Dyadobacter sp. CY261 TaxID=2907203 RepID=UPI001F2987D4|nr:FG-GAP-like repeat-containing protein [Dyadobacter sp. CY261]MCF0070618.1 FG-GAP-like repeat-containing protein [Dyadobacter sp. CY261]
MKNRNGLKIVLALCLTALVVGEVSREIEPALPGVTELPRNVSVKSKHLAAPNPVGADQAMLLNIISEREYHITPDAEGRLQSPNRHQNLRAYYEPGVLAVENRHIDEQNHFTLQLINQGIYADEKKLYMPESNATEDRSANQLRIKHAGFTEEFVNSKEGVRQNFVIDSAPEGARNLSVHLGINGLDVEDHGCNELHFYSSNGDGKQLQLVYNDIHSWDATGKSLASSLAYRGGEIVLEVDARNAVYPVTIDPIIVNGNPGNAAATVQSGQNSAGLGCSVKSAGDVNGDGYSDVVVGAYAYDNGEPGEGAAFVFHGSATGISTTATIVLEGNLAAAQFGFSVSGAGDVNKDGFSDIIVGAPKYTHGEVEEGAAFVFYGSGAGLSQSSVTILERDQASASLGYSVSTAGDVNGDGFSDVVVGAPFYDQLNANEGFVFVHYGSGSGVTTSVSTFAQSNFSGGALGFSVACAGDVNGDGLSDIIAGALGYQDPMASNTIGAAFVFHGSGVGLALSKTLWANTDANMGFSVAGAGDVNGDGYSDVVVGANKFREDDGAAFVFHGSGMGVSSVASITLTFVDSDAEMGNSVACAGDVNGDSFADIIVGAPKFSNGQNQEGAAFVYQGSLSGIKAGAVSTIEGQQASANMGFSVASSGDVNGDGYSDIVVGAYTYDDGNADEGAAFVFHGSAGTTSTSKIAKDGNQLDAHFGFSVAAAGDVNGDGLGDVIVGAPYFDNGEENEGAVFAFHGTVSGILLSGGLFDANQKDAQLGYSVSCAGDMNGDGYSDVVVGAPFYDNGEAKEGAAFVFKGNGSGLSFGWWQLVLDADQADAGFGYSVAGAGDVNGDGYGDVIVGAVLYDENQPDEGAAFVYHGSDQGVSLAPGKTISSGQTFSFMGWAVNGAGDINGDGYGDIVVSAAVYTKTQTEEGMVSVYYGSKIGIDYDSPQTFFGDQLGAGLGSSVGSAGDVNGDGFGDVVIGAYRYFNGLLEEGAALVYLGTSAGLDLPSVRILDSNQSGSWMGNASASAGDVNGDGYSDIIVGAHLYNFGAGQEGAVFIYHGSASGMGSQADRTIRLNQVGAEFGRSVAAAGDVNGDGYADVIIGADNYSNGLSHEGGSFVYLGNEGSAVGTRNNLTLYNSDLVTPINYNSYPKTDFGIGFHEKPFLGRTKGKLVWESRKEGESFSNVPITNSTQSTAQQGAYTDFGIFTVELKDMVMKLGKATRVRARTKYDPVTAITGQMYSPWRYISASLSGWSLNEGTPLPVTLIRFSAHRVENQADLKWATSSEVNSKNFEIQRSVDGKHWDAIAQIAAMGDSDKENEYNFTDNQPLSGENLYRLKMVDIDQSFAYSSIQSVVFDDEKVSVGVYPNPVSHQIRLNGSPEGVTSLKLINSVGQVVYENTQFTKEINVEKFPTGTYVLLISFVDGNQESLKVAINKGL